MSKRKGLSVDEKKARMLQLFHETKEFYQLKVTCIYLSNLQMFSISLFKPFLLGIGKNCTERERHYCAVGKGYCTKSGR